LHIDQRESRMENTSARSLQRRRPFIVTMENGRVVEDGAPGELLRSGGRFARLHAAQNAVFAGAAE
jgi:ABC-type bacteriocin/lantibiotic exporter with double-glycine peptidase domain